MSTLKQLYPEVFELYTTYPPMLDRACSCAIDLDNKRLMSGVLEALATTEEYRDLSCQFDAFALWLHKSDALNLESLATMTPVHKEARHLIIGEAQTMLDVLRCIENASHRKEKNTRITNALVVELQQLYKIFNHTLLQ